MLIVLEGCDGSGKTTLANKLAAILGAEIIHCTTETPNSYDFFVDIIEMSKTRNIIADRFCYGQFVYQKREDRPLRDEHNLYDLELEMMNAGVRVIYVDCDTEVMQGRLAQRGEETVKPVEKIQLAYANLFEKSLLPIVVADTTKPELALHPFWKNWKSRRARV